MTAGRPARALPKPGRVVSLRRPPADPVAGRGLAPRLVALACASVRQCHPSGGLDLRQGRDAQKSSSLSMYAATACDFSGYPEHSSESSDPIIHWLSGDAVEPRDLSLAGTM